MIKWSIFNVILKPSEKFRLVWSDVHNDVAFVPQEILSVNTLFPAFRK